MSSNSAKSSAIVGAAVATSQELLVPKFTWWGGVLPWILEATLSWVHTVCRDGTWALLVQTVPAGVVPGVQQTLSLHSLLPPPRPSRTSPSYRLSLLACLWSWSWQVLEEQTCQTSSPPWCQSQPKCSGWCWCQPSSTPWNWPTHPWDLPWSWPLQCSLSWPSSPSFSLPSLLRPFRKDHEGKVSETNSVSQNQLSNWNGCRYDCKFDATCRKEMTDQDTFQVYSQFKTWKSLHLQNQEFQPLHKWSCTIALPSNFATSSQKSHEATTSKHHQRAFWPSVSWFHHVFTMWNTRLSLKGKCVPWFHCGTPLPGTLYLVPKCPWSLLQHRLPLPGKAVTDSCFLKNQRYIYVYKYLYIYIYI